MKKTIVRTKYLEKMAPHIGKDIIKVFTGCRCVGMTTIFLQLIDKIKEIDIKANVIYINTWHNEFAGIRNKEDLLLYV